MNQSSKVMENDTGLGQGISSDLACRLEHNGSRPLVTLPSGIWISFAFCLRSWSRRWKTETVQRNKHPFDGYAQLHRIRLRFIHSAWILEFHDVACANAANLTFCPSRLLEKARFSSSERAIIYELRSDLLTALEDPDRCSLVDSGALGRSLALKIRHIFIHERTAKIREQMYSVPMDQRMDLDSSSRLAAARSFLAF